jgi:exodeoxyribonuclease V alpha subunit
VDGRWCNSKYGLQLDVASCVEVTPDTKEGIKAYLASGIIKGIGPKIAEAVVEMFGMETFEIFDKAPSKLLQVKGISARALQKIMESYNERKVLKTLVMRLTPFGITLKKCEAIFNAYGAASIQILQEDPFMLMSIRGFGFKVVDGIARKLGCKPNNPQRIQAAFLHLLGEAGRGGHLYVMKAELFSEAFKLLSDGYIDGSVSDDDLTAQYYQLETARAIVTDNSCVYPRLAYDNEVLVADTVAELLGDSVKPVDCSDLLEHVCPLLDIKLGPEQKNAVSMAFSNRISIITGGPGTGKTTILKAILEVYKRLYIGGKILLAAPTGKAARRMQESTQMNAMTLHKALRLKSDEEPEEGETNGLDFDFVVVDEFSMVDMSLCSWLFRSLKSNCTILLVETPTSCQASGQETFSTNSSIAG